MRPGAAIVAVLVLAADAVPFARGAEAESAALQRSRRASELIAGLEAEFVVERAIFAEELDRGVALGQWNEGEKDMALYSNSALLTASRASTPLRLWYNQRVVALRALRERARAELVSTTLDCAEEAWLRAENRADLEPALRQLNEAKAAVADLWNQVQALRRPSPAPYPGPPGSLPEKPLPLRNALDVHDFISVLASPEPFFLPDPARDPGAYKTGRMLWSGLEEIDHAFTRRPGIVARYHDYEDRLFEFQQTQRAALDALIVRDAPAAEFEPVYLRYTPAALPRQPYKQGSPSSRAEVIADYRDLVPRPDILAMLNRHPHLPRPGAPLAPVEELQAYGDWLAFRKAEERGEAAGIRAAREKVIKSRGRLQGKSYAFIGARLGLDPKPASVAPAAPDAAAQPLDALLAQLRALVAKDEKHAPAGRQVIAAWEKLRAGAASDTTAPHAGEFWTGLAARPGSRALFALRDQAARQLLAQIQPAAAADSAAPLPAELRGLLAAAVTDGAFATAKQLLALDAAAAILTARENGNWARDAEILSDAANPAKAGRRPAARAAYLQAIRQLADPALGAFAARTAKALADPPP